MSYLARVRTLVLAIVLGGVTSGIAHGSTLSSGVPDEPLRLEHSTAHIASDALPAIGVGVSSQLVVELGGGYGGTVDLRTGVRPADGRLAVSSSSSRRTLSLEPRARLLRAGICTAALGTPPPQF